MVTGVSSSEFPELRDPAVFFSGSCVAEFRRISKVTEWGILTRRSSLADRSECNLVKIRGFRRGGPFKEEPETEVPFQGRDRRSRARTGPGRGSRRATTSNRPDVPRVLFETLEPRVLLSSNDLIPGTTLFAAQPNPLSPVLIVPLGQHVANDYSQQGPTDIPSVQAQISTVSPFVMPQMVTPIAAGMDSSGSTGNESATPIMTVAGLSAAVTDEVPVSPIIVVDTSGSGMGEWTGGPCATLTFAGSRAAPIAPMAGVASNSAMGEVQGPLVANDLRAIPDVRHVEVESSISSSDGSITLVIPVDQDTESLALSLHPMEGNDGGAVPVVDGMMLIDRQGDPVAQIAPPWGEQQSPPPPVRSVTVSFQSAPRAEICWSRSRCRRRVAPGPGPC